MQSRPPRRRDAVIAVIPDEVPYPFSVPVPFASALAFLLMGFGAVGTERVFPELPPVRSEAFVDRLPPRYFAHGRRLEHEVRGADVAGDGY